ncbi:outer membrane protein assembly factor BamE [Dongia sp.]|uniref:outer membrane protein assembly factor BamE n=1 Tax=Dongia sp. TaxID=1977262 RepID=UPI003752E91D
MTKLRKTATALCSSLWLAGSLAGLPLVLGACSPTIQQEGNVPDVDQVVQINPGVDDKNRVNQLLGSPSAVSAFADRTWYYISRRTEQTAFLDPEVVDQEVLAISFDAQNIVQDLKVYGLEDGRMVAMVDRVTPTHGNNLTIVQQVLGNLGRFNNPDKKSRPY